MCLFYQLFLVLFLAAIGIPNAAWAMHQQPSAAFVDLSACSICYETHEHVFYTLTPCNHVFHTKCLTEWFQKKKECPLCRANFACDDEFEEGPGGIKLITFKIIWGVSMVFLDCTVGLTLATYAIGLGIVDLIGGAVYQRYHPLDLTRVEGMHSLPD